MAQEKFKSNLEFIYQIIVLSIKFRKGFSEFMKSIALFKKFLSNQFIASVEVSIIARCPRITYVLTKIDSIVCRVSVTSLRRSGRKRGMFKWKIPLSVDNASREK